MTLRSLDEAERFFLPTLRAERPLVDGHDFSGPVSNPAATNRPATQLADAAICLRPFQAPDLSALYAATRESCDLLSRWMTWCRPDYSLADCLTFLSQAGVDWEADRAFHFAIMELRSNTLAGSISLNQINRQHRSANLGYWVRQSFTRRGIASRAVRLAADFGLRHLRLNRLEIAIPDGNLASQRVAQKAGAKFEGILRRKISLQNNVHDALMFSLVESDLT